MMILYLVNNLMKAVKKKNKRVWMLCLTKIMILNHLKQMILLPLIKAIALKLKYYKAQILHGVLLQLHFMSAQHN